MEFLRRLLLQTQTYLKGMNGSQRLAIGACTALVAVSLLWLVSWAGEPSLAPLLDQPMSVQELAPIRQRLDSQGVVYQVNSTGTILVPTESRARLLAQLGQDRALPSDISIGFARMMEDSSPWLSLEEQGRRWSIARSYELSRVLKSFDGVVDARVLLDEKTRRTLGSAPVTPTASVFMKMAPGVPLTKEMVHAMASFVKAAVAGMDISNVAVTDASTGRSYTVPRPSDALAFDDLEDRQKKEEYFARKIKDLLANIPGLLVAVHADLTEESTKRIESKYGKPGKLTERSETMTQERSSGGAGPGVVANVTRANTAAGIDRTEKSVTEETFAAKVDETQTQTESPRHGIRRLTASVNVPRSYLAAIYRGINKGKDPTDADIAAVSGKEKEKIVPQVEAALGISKDNGRVEVTWFHDEAAVQMPETTQAGSSDTLVTLAKTYGGKIGVAGLGVMGLFMMLMMVRKVGGGAAMPGEEPPARSARKRRAAEPPMVLSAEPIGRAEETEQLLVAKEVDEQTVRTQQVVEQVQGLIKDDPGGAVGILQQWIDLEKA